MAGSVAEVPQMVIAYSPSFRGVPVGFASRFTGKIDPFFVLSEGQTYAGERRQQKVGTRRFQRVPIEMHLEGDKLVINTQIGESEERSLDGSIKVSDLCLRRGKLVYKLSAVDNRWSSNFPHSDEAEAWLSGQWDPQGYDSYD
ncbi:MAG: hypothetical protein KGJ07_05535 [Patescibacteria group bacterium]|nr:hypothetical protein [Patescibacteria group bacterium]